MSRLRLAWPSKSRIAHLREDPGCGARTAWVSIIVHQAIELGNRLIMMHEDRVVLKVDEAAKKTITAEALLEEFSKIKGASLSDRTLLD